MQGLVTVFGGTGFVGRYVVRALARQGWRIRVASRHPARAPELRVMGEVGQIEPAYANLRSAESVARALDGATAVVNLVGVLRSSGEQSFQALHADAAKTLAEAAAALGITRFVQVSAIGADANAEAEYARTKAAGEAAVRAAVPTATVLRPSIIFGPEDDFFNRFAAMAPFSPVMPLIGGGGTLFQPVYAGDVGAAVANALISTEAQGRTFELGGPAKLSFKALMQLMLTEIGYRRPFLSLPFGIAAQLGAAGDLMAFLPFAPITSDQVRMLKVDNVVSPGAPGLADLGVEATALEAVLPTYLWRFRKGGQFAQPEAHNVESPDTRLNPHQADAAAGAIG